MDLPQIAGIVLALIAAVLVIGGVAGFVTTAVNRTLQRRRQNAHGTNAPRATTAH